MSECVPELYRKCSVHDLQVHINCVCVPFIILC